jgi:hypothetical protein
MSDQTITTDAPAKPNTSANKAAWVDYAIARGMDAEAAREAKKADLMALFAEEATDEEKSRAKAPDTSGITAADIEAGFVSVGGSLAAAGAPVRERKPEQKLMDAVAEKAYQEWLDADRPSQWDKLPVVTYYLTDEQLTAYRYLIKRACQHVEPAEGSRGVTVRYGNVFTLSEKMANRLDPNNDHGLQDKIGLNVLMWAAVDRRTTSAG